MGEKFDYEILKSTLVYRQCISKARCFVQLLFHNCIEDLLEHHTAENVDEAMENILQEWKIESTKVVGATVDGA